MTINLPVIVGAESDFNKRLVNLAAVQEVENMN